MKICIILVLSISLVTCKEDELKSRAYPIVDTGEVTEITSDGAVLNGQILDLGSSGVADFGFVCDPKPGPTLAKSDRISLGKTSEILAFSAPTHNNLIKGTEYYIRAYAISNSGITVYGQEVAFISLGSGKPEIEDFAPKTGSIGDTIVINCKGLSTILESNKVTFGDVKAAVIKVDGNSLWCIVPPNTLLGESELSLTSGGVVVKPADKFTLKIMEFTAFTPEYVSFGDTLTITGKNFPLQKSYVLPVFLGQTGKIVSQSRTELKAVLTDVAYQIESPLRLTAGKQVITSSATVKLPAPVILDFTPKKGSLNTSITINGDNFSPVKGLDEIKINGQTLAKTEATRRKLVVTLPAITPGMYTISVTVAGQTVVSTELFEVD